MKTTIIKKPDAMYETFTRKVGKDQVTTHYCPGCGHGRVHKYIAEAMTELGISDRGVFISPVGCSVFAYYYMDMGNIQSAHGRAPAVGTGVSRSRKDSIVISYQGDGDLAAIGTAEIIHAANRGENMTVIFINNAIYGMTGGQMAPTTLVGQKSTTSPYGRKVENEGHPIRMAELMAQLEAPVFVTRVACTDQKNIMKTRKAIKKALKYQSEHKGFTFVEILATCPTNWKMTPVDSIKWLQENLEPYFKLGVFKDVGETKKPLERPEPEEDQEKIFKALNLVKGKTEKAKGKDISEKRLKIAGFGGQGVLTAGVIMSTAGMNEGLNVSWLPSYGPEMRGGTANCSVLISSKRIGSPLVTKPNVLIAMNGPSLDTFEEDVEKDGVILINTSIIDRKTKRNDVKVIYVPVTQIASDLGFKNSANMVAIGAYLATEEIFPKERIHEVIKTSLKKKQYVDINIKAVNAGYDFVKSN